MMGLNGLIVILAGSDSLTRLTCQLLPASIKLYRDQKNSSAIILHICFMCSSLSSSSSLYFQFYNSMVFILDEKFTKM